MDDYSPMSSAQQKDVEVEWYSGTELYTYPKRIKVDGRWEDVFQCERMIHEDVSSRQRKLVFRCHIGDNRIVEVVRKVLTIL